MPLFWKDCAAANINPGIVGVNIGANKDSTDRISDYVAGIDAFSDVASYFTINISSPNTPGLRNLQSAAELPALLKRLNEARQTQQRQVPMLLKIAPDLEADEMQGHRRMLPEFRGRWRHHFQHHSFTASAALAPREGNRRAFRRAAL